MTPDLLEEKETVLNKSVEMRLTTVDFADKDCDKVAVLYDVTARVEMSGVEAGIAMLVSVILLILEV